MDVKEAKKIVFNTDLDLDFTGTQLQDRAKGFLDAIEQLKATGAVATINRLLDGVRHSYNCPELKSGAACNCGFHETIGEGTKLLAKLNALLGEKDGRE